MSTLTIAISLIIAYIAVNIWAHKKETVRNNKLTESNEKMSEALLSFNQTMKNMKVDVVEFESMRRWIGELLDQLQKHNDKMDQINTTSITIDPIGGEMSEEELEKMIDEIRKTGAISILAEPTVFSGARPHLIDRDIVEAFEKRVEYYKHGQVKPLTGSWKRQFITDFETIDEWSNYFKALNKIQNFDMVINLLSGNYEPYDREKAGKGVKNSVGNP